MDWLVSRGGLSVRGRLILYVPVRSWCWSAAGDVLGRRRRRLGMMKCALLVRGGWRPDLKECDE